MALRAKARRWRMHRVVMHRAQRALGVLMAHGVGADGLRGKLHDPAVEHLREPGDGLHWRHRDTRSGNGFGG